LFETILKAMPDDRPDESWPEPIAGTFAQCERDERYLQGLWSEVPRTQAIIQRALSAVEESKGLLDRLFPQSSAALRPDASDGSD
jgi:hypothetical protein